MSENYSELDACSDPAYAASVLDERHTLECALGEIVLAYHAYRIRLGSEDYQRMTAAIERARRLVNFRWKIEEE